MNDQWLDVVAFRKRPNSDKPFAVKIGSARLREDGGVDIYLDALPLPDENGRVSLRASKRREAGGAYGRSGSSSGGGRVTTGSNYRAPVDEDDDVPF